MRDVINEIVSHLKYPSLVMLSRTNRYFHDLCRIVLEKKQALLMELVLPKIIEILDTGRTILNNNTLLFEGRHKVYLFQNDDYSMIKIELEQLRQHLYTLIKDHGALIMVYTITFDKDNFTYFNNLMNIEDTPIKVWDKLKIDTKLILCNI